jgi:ubiquinol-cytochrome c reductase cytochrome b subunit
MEECTMTTAARFWKLLPGLFLAALLLCLGSGVVLAFQYRPMGNVFQNVEEITTLVPFGFFFRRLHYASGHVCVILALVHVLRFFFNRGFTRFSVSSWTRLTTGLAVCLLILLTGFILKADEEARMAGAVLRNLVGSLPLIGPAASAVVIGEGEAIFFLPYLHHCFVLPTALFVLLRGHVRQWLPRPATLAVAALLLGAWSVFAPMPLPVTARAMPEAATGPWFFLGLQELLKHGPPFVMGMLLPLGFLVLFNALPALEGRTGRAVWWAAAGSMGAYALLATRMVAM